MKIAIIGTGRVSGEHIKAYQASGAEVVALCSRTKDGAQKKAVELGLTANVYDDFDSLLEREEVDAVSVCSPPELHVEHVVKAADAGKHIAIEKPVTLNQRDLMAMCEAVQKAGVKTIVGFVLRWNDLVLNIKRDYMSELGRIFYVETDYWHGQSHIKPYSRREYGTRRGSLGTFIGGGCHAVDMARFLIGSDITEVSALNPRDQDGEIQRTTVALMTFENGVVGKVSATDEVFMPYCFNIQLFGNSGAIRLNRFYAKSTGKHEYTTIPGVLPDSGAVTHHPFTGMMSEFIECIRQGTDTSCSLQDALNIHLACFAAEESARRSGITIRL